MLKIFNKILLIAVTLSACQVKDKVLENQVERLREELKKSKDPATVSKLVELQIQQIEKVKTIESQQSKLSGQLLQTKTEANCKSLLNQINQLQKEKENLIKTYSITLPLGDYSILSCGADGFKAKASSSTE